MPNRALETLIPHGPAFGEQTKLERLLGAQPKEGIIEFFNEYIRASSNLWSSKLSDLLRGRSDDTQKDIYEYIVAQGKEYYAEVLAHPERAPIDVDSNDVWIKGVALGVYWDRYGERIPRHYFGQ